MVQSIPIEAPASGPVSRHTVTSQVYRQLRDGLMSGRCMSGQKLTNRVWAGYSTKRKLDALYADMRAKGMTPPHVDAPPAARRHPEDVAQRKRTADRLFGDDYRWSVLGAGANQMNIAALSAANGGNIRVGLDGSLWGRLRKLAESSAEQVAKARLFLEGLGFEIATPDEAREMRGLKRSAKVGF